MTAGFSEAIATPSDKLNLLLPDVSLISKGQVSMSGQAQIKNPEARYSIWSGLQARLIKQAHSSSRLGPSSSIEGNGGDIAEYDANLAKMSDAEFFQNIFGWKKSAVIQHAQLNISHRSNAELHETLNGVSGKIIYLSQAAGSVGSLSQRTQVGTKADPVILILDGQFRVKGQVHIYGLVYSDGDWLGADEGKLKINGMLIVNGDTKTMGETTVIYEQEVVNNLDRF